MDTSEEYVRMCRESIEIQKKWKEDRADFYFDDYYKYVTVLDSFEDNLGNNIWLPRQDQLQAILDSERPIGSWHWFIYDMWEYDRGCVSVRDWSGEKLWLALVMKELYGKGWNGSTWEI